MELFEKNAQIAEIVEEVIDVLGETKLMAGLFSENTETFQKDILHILKEAVKDIENIK